MENPKRVSAIKPTTEIPGFAFGFNCSGGNPKDHAKDVENAIAKCQVDRTTFSHKSAPASWDASFLIVYGKQEKDVIAIRQMLLSPAFGYIEY